MTPTNSYLARLLDRLLPSRRRLAAVEAEVDGCIAEVRELIRALDELAESQSGQHASLLARSKRHEQELRSANGALTEQIERIRRDAEGAAVDSRNLTLESQRMLEASLRKIDQHLSALGDDVHVQQRLVSESLSRHERALGDFKEVLSAVIVEAELVARVASEADGGKNSIVIARRQRAD